MVSAFSDYAPELVRPVTDSLDKGKTDLGFFRLDPDSWSGCKDVSIDYAIMEKADNLVALGFQPAGLIWAAGMRSGQNISQIVMALLPQNMRLQLIARMYYCVRKVTASS